MPVMKQPAENNDDTKKEHVKELFSLLDASATNINFSKPTYRRLNTKYLC